MVFAPSFRWVAKAIGQNSGLVLFPARMSLADTEMLTGKVMDGDAAWHMVT